MYSANRRRTYYKSPKLNKREIFDKHDWICVICGKSINKRFRVPHPLAVTLEHIIPLCRGGTHTEDNVGPAHLQCNKEKGEMLLEEYLAIRY